jgi:hypothetical protein
MNLDPQKIALKFYTKFYPFDPYVSNILEVLQNQGYIATKLWHTMSEFSRHLSKIVMSQNLPPFQGANFRKLLRRLEK